MLSKTTIIDLIKSDQLITFESDNDKEEFVNKSIQSSSIDLSVDLIFKPGCIDKENENQNYSSFGEETATIKAGETLVVQIRECFDFPKDVAGIIFPPNKLAKSGLIMTNPGHIDPGYRGKITVCLVNMGKKEVQINRITSIATLLIFKTDKQTEGYQAVAATGVSKKQIDSLSPIFADIESHVKKGINSVSRGYIGFIITILGVIMGTFAFAVPEIAKILDNGNKVQTLNDKYVVPLEATMDLKIEKLRNSKIAPIEASLDKKINSLKDSDIAPLESKMDAKIKQLETRIKQLEMNINSIKNTKN
jgi:deoxycytidine triphosphate deaminase